MRKIFLLFMFVIFLTSLTSAIVSQTNYFKYGTIDSDGNLVKTSTPINNVNIVGFICANLDCSNFSGSLWGGSVLTSIGNQIVLTYPTVQSPYGYAIYMYKDNSYRTYEVKANWNGAGTATCTSRYLTKQKSCTSEINSFDISINENNLDVDVNVQSPLEHMGPLDYFPPELISYYSTTINITIEITDSNTGNLVYTESKQKTVEYSNNVTTSFSTDLNQGDYKVEVYTTLDNEAKCLSYLSDMKQQLINIPYPDKDGDGYTSNVDCDDDDASIWQLLEGYTDWDQDNYGTGPNGRICSGDNLPSGHADNNNDCNDSDKNINPGTEEVCGDGIDNNCNGEIDEGCVEECGNGIEAGAEECDDGNTENGDGCSSECLIEEPSCGNNIKEGSEECDWGEENGVECDNSSSSCTYCSYECELTTLNHESENLIPTISISSNTTEGIVPLSIMFTSQGSGGDGVLTYFWDFGDGSSSNSQNIEHIYSTTRTFTSTATVTDEDGDTASDSITIKVESKPSKKKKSERSSSCTPEWECSEWNNCLGGYKTRICSDLYYCGKELSKPIEKVRCENGYSESANISVIRLESQKEESITLREVLTGTSWYLGIGAIILLIIILLVLLTLLRRR